MRPRPIPSLRLSRARTSRLTSSRRLKRIAVVAIVVAVALAAGVWFARQSGNDPDRYGNDFSVYYFAARELLMGNDPYQHSIGPWTPYLYPPLLAELILPLALFVLPLAAYAWFLINAGATIGLARISAHLAVSEEPADQDALPTHGANQYEPVTDRQVWVVAALAAVICGRFLLDNFKLGQVNTVVAALAAFHVVLYVKGRPRLSAFLLALAVSIKLTPALLVLYHFARGRWRFGLGTGLLIAVVGAASFLPFGLRVPEVFAQFYHRTVRNQQGFDLAYSGNQSLRGFAGRLAGESGEAATPPAGGPAPSDAARQPENRVAVALSLLALIGAVGAAVVARTEAAAAAPFFCCLVLLSPLSWKVHYVIMVLPVALLLQRTIEARASQRRILVSVLVVTFGLFDLTSHNVFGLAFAEWADSRSLVLAGGVLVYAATIWQAVSGNGRRQFVNLKPARRPEAIGQ